MAGPRYVAVLPAVGGPARTVTRDRTRALTGPVWTPDGTAVVYQGVDVRTRVVRAAPGTVRNRRPGAKRPESRARLPRIPPEAPGHASQRPGWVRLYHGFPPGLP